MTLEDSDIEAASVAKGPRVALHDIENAIVAQYSFIAWDAMRALGQPASSALRVLTICLLVMKNGFTVVGKSAPASAENFNAELGAKLAYEDAIRQLWPLMGYALRDKLNSGEKA